MVEREQLVSMVRGLQNGEEDAAARLYETFQSDIYYFILKTVNNDRELAEDLTQDTFMEILETIHKIQEPAAFVTWSRQIAYHKCTAYFRKRKELLVDENEDGYSVFETIEEENIEFIPDAALDHEDLKQTILKMINDLPEEQKSAIILRYFNEISVKEIAEIQGVTEGTVKSRLNYGRKSIKQAVEEFEKKNGVRLHCVGVLPLLLWLFKNYRLENDLHITSKTAMQSFVIGENASKGAAIIGASSSSAAVSTTATTTTSATAATSTAATAATATVAKTATGFGLKLAGKAITAKMIAYVAVAAVAVGGTAVGVATLSEPEPTEMVQEETQESWVTETTLPFVMEETTIPTEETTVPTEETTAPTEEAVTETSVVVTPAATEAPTEAPTETPTATECKHDWSYYSESYDMDDVPEYEDRTCLKCGAFEVLYQAEQPNCGNHDFLYYTSVGYDTIHETKICNICGWQETTAYPNTCSHSITQYTEQINTMLYTYDQCTLCGYNQLVSTTEVSCEHDWVYSSFERDGQLHEVRDCGKCNAHEVVSVTEICQHEWQYNAPAYTVDYIYEDRVCTKCGLAEVSSIENPCRHVWVSEINANEYTFQACDRCSNCSAVTNYVETPNTCVHTWTSVSWADEYQIHQYEECTSCNVCRNDTHTPNPCTHAWEEQQVLDEGGNVIAMNYYCPNCNATK